MFEHAPVSRSRTGKTALAAACGLLLLASCAACSAPGASVPIPLGAVVSPTAMVRAVSPTPKASASPLPSAVSAGTPSPSAQATATAAPASPAPSPSARAATHTAPKQTPKPTSRPTPQQTATPKPTATPASGLRSLENEMISLVNGERAKAGLKPLAYDAGLRAAALKHSQDMLENHYFDHTSPVYGTFQQRLAASGVKYSTAGENIAYYPSMQAAHTGLMNSPGHRANILNSAFTRIGIGIVYDGANKMYYFTQWFAG